MLLSHIPNFPDMLRPDAQLCPRPCMLRRAHYAVSSSKPQPLGRGARYAQSLKSQYGNAPGIRREDCEILQEHGDDAIDASLDDGHAENIADRGAEDGFFDGKAYRLVPVEGGEHTILINGIQGVDIFSSPAHISTWCHPSTPQPLSHALQNAASFVGCKPVPFPGRNQAQIRYPFQYFRSTSRLGNSNQPQ
ncbi:hypothetical protein Vretimale_3912 [Volvox reticuliferus]|uniref:Uncharacterized protein n=1 Tax=Volvox reticuliferus TaxID=1737510 RepID=A0A8J4D9U8_9CHLO|nr:hypothetical protein Vretimale_3912 [Volvox reticuliferus]